MDEVYEYKVNIHKTGWFTIAAHDLQEAYEIAGDMDADELDEMANWEEAVFDDVD
jgi:flagellar basal body rod protein FlgF